MNDIEYVGIDYHTKFAIATRMTKDGEIVSRDKVPTTKADIQEYLSELPVHSKVALEATNNWYTFVEWAHELPIDIVLAHPLQLRAIATARIKTDTIDSKIIADLLRTNFIPESYIAPKEVRDTRELVRYRTTLVRIRQQFLIRIHSVLFKTGESLTGTTFLSKKGQKALADLPVRSIYKQEILSCLLMCDELTKQIALFEMQIKNQATADEHIAPCGRTRRGDICDPIHVPL